MNWCLSISNELDLPTCAKEPRTGIGIAREALREPNRGIFVFLQWLCARAVTEVFFDTEVMPTKVYGINLHELSEAHWVVSTSNHWQLERWQLKRRLD
jgi:hypothetical protein